MKKLLFYSIICLSISCTSVKTIAYETPDNLIEDGSFEAQKLGTLEKPYIIRPFNAITNFSVKDNANKTHGSKLLRINAKAGDWWGISQKIQLQQGKKYTTTFLVRGDKAEMHCGAVNSGVFFGWNNAVVPNKNWQRVSYDFYVRDDSSGKTAIYIYFKHPSKDVTVEIDELKVTQELPVKIQ